MQLSPGEDRRRDRALPGPRPRIMTIAQMGLALNPPGKSKFLMGILFHGPGSLFSFSSLIWASSGTLFRTLGRMTGSLGTGVAQCSLIFPVPSDWVESGLHLPSPSPLACPLPLLTHSSEVTFLQPKSYLLLTSFTEDIVT